VPTDRRCTAQTRSGDPCKASPLRDQNVCLAHADAKTRESTGFVAVNGKAGRPRNPRPAEVARRLIEENVLAIQRPYWRTLGYDVELTDDGPRLVELVDGGAKLHGTSKDGNVKVSSHDDLGAHMAAAEKLQDRVYGRPKQATELTGAGGGPVEIVDVAKDRGGAVARLLSGIGAVRD
jgi:hypothetical protein